MAHMCSYLIGYFRRLWREHVVDDFSKHYPKEPWLL